MTADRGLCGGFNGNIVRRAREQIRDLQKQGKKVQLFLIGRKGGDLLKRLYDDLIIKTVALSERKAVDSRFASEVAEDIVMMYEREILIYVPSFFPVLNLFCYKNHRPKPSFLQAGGWRMLNIRPCLTSKGLFMNMSLMRQVFSTCFYHAI